MANQINAELNPGSDINLFNCGGIRVFYYDRTKHASPCSMECFISDHDHTSEWNDECLKKQEYRCLETGTVVRCWRNHIDYTCCLDVWWDCGTKKMYTRERGEWENVCVLDMGPAGYRAPIVLCDVCLTPLTGFSFRCTNGSCSKGLEEVFDLCYKHYNRDYHFENGLKDHLFQCIMQTKFTFEPNSNTGLLPSRIESKSTKYCLVGLFPGAVVIKTSDRTMKGRLMKVVHKDGNKEFSMATAWNCTAEVKYEGCKELVYEDIGTEGKVDISALEPGDGESIYADHFPKIGDDILKETSQFHLEIKRLQLKSGYYCYISQDPPNPSITISNTTLSEIDSELNLSQEFEGLHDGLKILNFLHNQLKRFPHQLLQYKESLQIAALSFNSFDCIPDEVFRFSALKNLNLIHNQIAIVPKDIQSLSNLQDLFLDSNSIRVLPDELCELHSLHVLGLSCNLLVSLPASFSKLNNLHRLELHHNHFKVFPSVLCSPELQRVSSLSLDNNRIQVIPESAKNLISNLSSFTIFNNPLQINNAFEHSNADLIRSIISDSCPRRPRGHIRITVLGESGSGKSSLVKALVDRDKYVTPADKEVYDHTVGIDQYSYRFSLEGGVYEVTLWDFAGEKSYAMMNHMFLSQGTLVWFVFDMSKYDVKKQICFEESIGEWLRSVIACISTPTVWIIGTHADKCRSPECIITSVEQKVIQELRQVEKTCSHRRQCFYFDRPGHASARHSPNMSYIRKAMKTFAISNAHDLRGHDDLQKSISNLPHHFPELFKDIDIEWSSAQEYISELASEELRCLHSPIIKKDKLHSLLKENNLIKNDADFENLLEYLHQTGEILYFRKTESSCIFLDPVWLIILLKEIFRVDVDKYVEKKVHKKNADTVLHALESTASLSKKTLMDGLWKQKGVTEASFPEIVDCLFNFGLAFDASKLLKKECCYLFPWFRKESKIKITFSNAAQQLSLGPHHITLVYMFSFIPATFFERLLTYCTKDIEVCDITRSFMSAKIRDHDVYVFTMLDYEEDCDHCDNDDRDLHKGYVVFIVSNQDPKADRSYNSMWSSHAHLSRGLRTLLKDWWHCTCPDISVACPECIREGIKNPQFFDFNVLEEQRTHRCHRCQHKILADKLFPPHAFFEDIVIRAHGHDHVAMSTVTEATCTTHFLNRVACHESVQIQWKRLAKSLQVSEDVITKIESNYQRETLYERCFQMLHEWSRQAGCHATVHRLQTALREMHVEVATYDAQ